MLVVGGVFQSWPTDFRLLVSNPPMGGSTTQKVKKFLCSMIEEKKSNYFHAILLLQSLECISCFYEFQATSLTHSSNVYAGKVSSAKHFKSEQQIL